MPYPRPTLPALVDQSRNDLESRIDGADAHETGSNLAAAGAVMGAGFDGVYGSIDNLSLQAFPQTATGAFLDKAAAQRNVTRKLAQAAYGAGTAPGSNGTPVGAGTALQRADGAQFITSADAEVSGGSITLQIVATVAGSAGNTAAGQTLTFVTPVPGVSKTVTIGAAGIELGFEAETDDQLRQRLMQVWQEPPQGGATWDYIERALQVPGVTRAWVHPGWMGAGTVWVSFVMDDQAGSIFPGDAAVAAVTAHLNDPTWKPVTAKVSAFAPTPAPCNFTIKLDPTSIALQGAVTAAFQSLFFTDQSTAGAFLPPDGSQIAGVIAYPRMWSTLEGVLGAASGLLVAPTADFVAPSGSLPTLGTIAFTT